MVHLAKIALAALTLILAPRVCSSEEPLEVSVCQVLSSPNTYDHKLIKIDGDISRGFEDFTLTSQNCQTQRKDIWLDLGGSTGSQVMYCCGVTEEPKRAKPLVVDGIPTTLVKDSVFEQFQALTLGQEGHGSARATVVGRFFAGENGPFPGYGHMGLYSLLVIQQVLSTRAE
jgi:hypothetical protein